MARRTAKRFALVLPSVQCYNADGLYLQAMRHRDDTIITNGECSSIIGHLCTHCSLESPHAPHTTCFVSSRSLLHIHLFILFQKPNEAPSVFASSASASASARMAASALITTSPHWRLLPRPQTNIFEAAMDCNQHHLVNLS